MRSLGYTLVLILLFSCSSNTEQSQGKSDSSRDLEEKLIYANKRAVKEENEQIERFIKRYKWQMKETGSGLRYDIYYQGIGDKAVPGKLAILKFSLRLIDGTAVYSSEKDGFKQFVIGHGGVESGLEEGILLLRVGDRAKFIIPSHLGFGLLGDQDKVPPKSTLIYDIELVALN
ncbi:MAG: peptidylprolyl isomerase [Lentimicrobium sp.]|nr:peptidylprolyl isomerase [Lentimicrobium sp.]